MISAEEALELVSHTAAPLAPRPIAPEDACGLVLAEDILADRDYPPFDRSMMDGFAVRLADAGRAVELAGEVAAGSVWNAGILPGQCIEILTGAPCPSSAEAVVPKEIVERRENAVVLPAAIRAGQNIARMGSDCRAGQCILEAGSVISSMAVGTIATFGRATVLAIPRPTLGIITTGAELAQPGEPLPPGHIRNSNGPMLAAMARELGLPPSPRWHAADDLAAIERALEEANGLDIVVLSGGVSVGAYDFVPAALARLGAEVIFHGVNQKPGKPILFARRGGQMIFGLPGNPLSSHFCFQRYVSAAVRRMSGLSAAGVLQGGLKEGLESKGFRPRYLPATAEASGNSELPWEVSILPERSSADIFQPCRANCYVELPAGPRVYGAGDAVSFTWISP
jgi:molybdopterin molybdotransferase